MRCAEPTPQLRQAVFATASVSSAILVAVLAVRASSVPSRLPGATDPSWLNVVILAAGAACVLVLSALGIASRSKPLSRLPVRLPSSPGRVSLRCTELSSCYTALVLILFLATACVEVLPADGRLCRRDAPDSEAVRTVCSVQAIDSVPDAEGTEIPLALMAWRASNVTVCAGFHVVDVFQRLDESTIGAKVPCCPGDVPLPAAGHVNASTSADCTPLANVTSALLPPSTVSREALLQDNAFPHAEVPAASDAARVLMPVITLFLSWLIGLAALSLVIGHVRGDIQGTAVDDEGDFWLRTSSFRWLGRFMILGLIPMEVVENDQRQRGNDRMRAELAKAEASRSPAG